LPRQRWRPLHRSGVRQRWGVLVRPVGVAVVGDRNFGRWDASGLGCRDDRTPASPSVGRRGRGEPFRPDRNALLSAGKAQLQAHQLALAATQLERAYAFDKADAATRALLLEAYDGAGMK